MKKRKEKKHCSEVKEESEHIKKGKSICIR
jgi:hypothetical protein